MSEHYDTTALLSVTAITLFAAEFGGAPLFIA
jgi:hypothetical protein